MTRERIREIIEFIMDVEADCCGDPGLIQEELEGLGYQKSEIGQAFNALASGAGSGDRLSDGSGGGSRVFGEFEKSVLSVAAQGYLLMLRRSGVLSEAQLSMIIDAAAFELAPPVSLDEARELAARYVVDLPDDGFPDTARRDGPLH